jgi:hypothetical protein
MITSVLMRERIKNLVGPPARPIFGLLGYLEYRLLPDYQLRYSPTFIVGPPRSGTTLLSQIVTCALTTSYFTNLASRLRVQGIRRPPVILSARLAELFKLTERHQETFQSHYGHTKGWGAPAGDAMIFKHWFPNRFMGPGEVTAETQRCVYQAVAGTEQVFGYPFVSKTVENSVRIGALLEIFPTAVFLRCVRNPLAIAQSIYVARTQTGYPCNRWFSTKPKEVHELRQKSLEEQVCGQVYYVEQNMAEGLAPVEPDRILSVDYEQVCLNPRRQIGRIASFLGRNGAPTKHIRTVPASFPYSAVRRIDSDTYRTLTHHLEDLYGYQMERLNTPQASDTRKE